MARVGLGALLLGVILVGCGYATSDSSGIEGAGGASAGGMASGGSVPGGATSMGAMIGCYAAVQADACCSPALAADRRAPTDPCLVPFEEAYEPATVSACPNAEPCGWHSCMYRAPPSRVVTRDETGTCIFADECGPAAIDCVVASDLNRCCSCPEVLPRLLVEADPCIVTGVETPPTGCADCSNVQCGSCSGELPIPACATEVELGLGTCTAAVW